MTDRFIEGFPLGLWQANCYVLGDRDRGEAVVVDPGQDAQEAVSARLAAHGCRCAAILLTHGHIDHLWSAPALAETFDVPVFLHPEDRYLWRNPAAGFGNVPLEAVEAQLGLRWAAPEERLQDVSDGMSLTLAGVAFTVRHSPGHTPGSSVYLVEGLRAELVLLSGDLLFAGSVGRTDFPRGSAEQQDESLRRVVLPLHDATLVLSGHGPETTVGAERVGNPFLHGLQVPR